MNTAPGEYDAGFMTFSFAPRLDTRDLSFLRVLPKYVPCTFRNPECQTRQRFVFSLISQATL